MGQSSSTRLLALHGLRLLGVAEAETIADELDVEVGSVNRELDTLDDEGLVTYRYGRISGYSLTDRGRAEGERLVAEELDAAGGRAVVEAAYADFQPVNADLLDVCTDWQLRVVGDSRRPNEHDDPVHDERVLGRLHAVHTRVLPILDQLRGVLDRFGGHERRLRFALDRIDAGDYDYVTKPMFPSYHSVWFELHEDLLATLGRTRTPEGST